MTTHAHIPGESRVPRHRGGDNHPLSPLVLPAVSRVRRRFSGIYPTAAMLAMVALAALLRLYGLARQSGWADEITTLFIADPSLSLGQFWGLVLSDSHPPLFYLLMRWWSALFGQSDLAARLPSVFFGVLTVGAGAVAFGQYPLRNRLTLMLLIAVSPGAIEYAQEARSYSLLLFLSTVITGACFRLISSHREDDRDVIPASATLAVSGIIASYTHYFGFLIAVAAGLTAVVATRGERRRLIGAGAGLAAIIGAFLPWVIYHSHHISYGVSASAWIADFPVGATIAWFVRLWLGGTPALLGCMVMTAALLLMPSFRAFARRDAACRLGPSLAFITIAAAVAVSWYTPILTSRNLIVILPALYLMMSSLVGYVAVRWGAAATTATLAVLLVFMTQSLPWYYTAMTKEQWRESAAFVLAQPGCAVGPIYVYGETPNYRYLVGKARPTLKLIEIPLGSSAALSPPDPATDCNVLLWAAFLPRSEFDAVLSSLPVDRSCVRVAEFYWAYVAVREPADATTRGGCPPGQHASSAQ